MMHPVRPVLVLLLQITVMMTSGCLDPGDAITDGADQASIGDPHSVDAIEVQPDRVEPTSGRDAASMQSSHPLDAKLPATGHPSNQADGYTCLTCGAHRHDLTPRAP
jgi:hypothetical protein